MPVTVTGPRTADRGAGLAWPWRRSRSAGRFRVALIPTRRRWERPGAWGVWTL